MLFLFPESPEALYAEYNPSRFLIRRFISCVTQGKDHLQLSSLVGMHSFNPLYQSGVGGEEAVQGIALSGWLCHHLKKAKVVNQVKK